MSIREVWTGTSEKRSARRTRFVPWVIAGVAFAVLVSACGAPPSATHTITGTSTQGAVSDLRQDDNSYYVTDASCTGEFMGCATDWYGSFSVGSGDVSSDLRVEYIGKNEGAGQQFVSVWNWQTMSWFPIDAFRVVAGDEVTVEHALPTGSWLTNKGVGFVRVTTIGNLSSSSADVLLGCLGDCTVWSGLGG